MLVRILYSFIVVLNIFCAVNGHTFKSSLAFVIDRTNSMQYVIKNVINETDMIFDAVLKSNSSVIEDFVLVAFDDPNVELLTKTTDRNNFKKALHSITIQNGYDCPEYSMSGIEKGLNFSKPNSFLYVFTNAFAKDYIKIDAVRSLSQEKGIQVNFLLTGTCKKYEPIQYNVYEDITKATSGQIFHSDKEDVNKIINYIVESIKYKRTILKRTDTKEGENKIKFSVDSKIRNVLIAVSSKHEVYYTLTDLAGNAIETEPIVQTSNCSVGKVILKPGTYTVLIDEHNKTSSVVISGETKVCFQYGFSTTKSATLNETSTKPIDSTENQFLSIELDNIQRDIQLETADLTDIDDNIIQVLTLTLVNEEQQFYVTESFKPPSGMFKIAVNGLTKTKEKIRRVSTSTTQYQNPEIEPVPPYTPPTVTITPESPVFVEPDELLTLKCLVDGYPEPDVKWTDDSGEILTPKPMYTVRLRRLYASVLEITKPSKNMTISCIAISEKGDMDSKSIDVKIKNKIYLKVLEYPKDKKLGYKENAEFKCKVDSWPAATITWFRNKKIISSDENFIISPDSSTLMIKEANARLQGEYSVNISNTYETKVFSFQVKVPKSKAPKIDKENSIYANTTGGSVNMTCRLIQGEPNPNMTWSFNKDGSRDYEDLKNAQYFYYIDEIKVDHSGIYRCEAINIIDKDFHEMQLVVKRPPSVKVLDEVRFKEGERVRLDCIVDGSPKLSVQWRFNSVNLGVSSRYKIYPNNSLSFIGNVLDNGNYHCVAKNSEGEMDKNTRVLIYQPLRIESPEETVITLNVGTSIKLYCNISGYPIPRVTWWRDKFEKKSRGTLLREQKNQNLPHELNKIQIGDEGKYTCVAENEIEKISIQYEVHVLAAPSIKKKSTEPFYAVVGDQARRVICEANGSPKPTITWYKNGLVLAKGEFYDFDDFKLIIKYPDLSSQGTYVCNASNTMGYDTAEYEVIVKEYVDINNPKLALVVEGSTSKISCGKKSQTDHARWFKNGRFYKDGDTIELHKAKRSDSGIYTCRVDSEYYYSYNPDIKKVIVGSKPKFTSEAPKIILFKEGATETLDCEARGYPEPTIKWRKGKIPLNEKSMLYKLTMTKENIEKYTCELENEFGSIKRNFQIKSEACYLPKANYYGENMPLILSHTGIFVTQRTIGLGGNILIECPNSLLIYNKERLGSYVPAKCVNETQFLINGKEYNISNIKCKKKIEPQYHKTNTTCAPGNTELVQVRFKTKTENHSIFDVCIDKDKYKIYFVNYKMHPSIANTSFARATFRNDTLLPLNFNDIYNCDKQLKSIYATTGEKFSKDGKCCFGKRQLLSPIDVLPGVAQETTYTYLNVVPVWSSCSQENWDEVERRVRSLVYDRDYTLDVWTGSSHSIILESDALGPVELSLNDQYDIRQKVPLYLWKVISDRQNMSSLAVVLINYPNLNLKQASDLAGRICTDICDKTDWMKNSEWKKPNKGFIFCCEINDFEKAFNYKYLFKGRTKILKG